MSRELGFGDWARSRRRKGSIEQAGARMARKARPGEMVTLMQYCNGGTRFGDLHARGAEFRRSVSVAQGGDLSTAGSSINGK
jgi:hypothetical protein